MNPLTFTLKIKPRFTLDVSPLIPDLLSTMNNTQIKSIKLSYGKEMIQVDKLFNVSGDNKENICIKGSCDKLHHVGKGMSVGSLTVQGDVGDFLGQEMQGGYIKIQGNTRAWAGCSMAGGKIDILGNTGDNTGAGIPGDPHGMSNGMIYISGNAGDRLGDRMRRGIIIVCGMAGDYVGSRMNAGTIIVLGETGKNAGVAMMRGSIILGQKPKHIYATFGNCGNLKMEFLRLLFKQLYIMGGGLKTFKDYGAEVLRFSGDHARSGKGEILILKTPRQVKK